MAIEQQKRHSVPTIVIMLFRSEKKNDSQLEHNSENLDFLSQQKQQQSSSVRTGIKSQKQSSQRWLENVHLLVQMRFVLMTSYISKALLLYPFPDSCSQAQLQRHLNPKSSRRLFANVLWRILPRDSQDAAVQASPFPCFLKTKFIGRLNKRQKKFFNFTELQPFNCVSNVEAET